MAINKLEHIVIFSNDSKEKANELLNEIESYLDGEGITYSLYEEDMVVDNRFDLALILGGDGTVLRSSRFIKDSGVPIMAFNLGTLGFIADFKPEHWQQALQDFKNNQLQFSPRRLLQVELTRNGQTLATTTALNDAVIVSSGDHRLISLTLLVNQENWGPVRSDALVVASSTGSTAYALSAGGPIIPPSLDALSVVAVSPFSLSIRPVVLPCDAIVHLVINKRQRTHLALNIDGEELFKLQEDDRVSITSTPYTFNLLTPNDYSFYQVLKQKLGWKGQT